MPFCLGACAGVDCDVRGDGGKTLFAAILGIGETVDHLVAHADRMVLQARPVCDLFGGPADLEPVLSVNLEVRENNHLSISGEAALIHVLLGYGVVTIRFGKFRICVPIPLNVSLDCRSIAAQTIGHLAIGIIGFKPLGNPPAFIQIQVRVVASRSISSVQTSVLFRICNSFVKTPPCLPKSRNLGYII